MGHVKENIKKKRKKKGGKKANSTIWSLIKAAWKSLANLQAIHLNLPKLQER